MVTFSHEPMSWPEAEAAFVGKEILTAEQFALLREQYRGYAFTASLIQEYAVLIRIKAKLEQIIENGETLAEFQTWAATDGILWTDAYSELVYRMATQGAYSRARWVELNDPDIVEEFPLLMYDTAGDDRVRSTHAAMDGFTATREEFPPEWIAPNGFNCRCIVRALNDDLLDRAGDQVKRTRPTADADGNPVIPDEGFRSNQNEDYGAVLDAQLEQAKRQLGA